MLEDCLEGLCIICYNSVFYSLQGHGIVLKLFSTKTNFPGILITHFKVLFETSLWKVGAFKQTKDSWQKVIGPSLDCLVKFIKCCIKNAFFFLQKQQLNIISDHHVLLRVKTVFLFHNLYIFQNIKFEGTWSISLPFGRTVLKCSLKTCQREGSLAFF